MIKTDIDVENGLKLMTIYDKNTLNEVEYIAYLNFIALTILTS